MKGKEHRASREGGFQVGIEISSKAGIIKSQHRPHPGPPPFSYRKGGARGKDES